MHQQSHASRKRLAAALAGIALLLGSVLALPSAPATADSTYLCSGYQACADQGYPHAGYRGNSATMYWQMYGGHNCTNYAAYRMVRSGMPNKRPWSGEGNASNWGVAMKHITDQTPTVGAIAWWKANVPGAGSSGHVAYVEQVVSSTTIVVSEDSWGGDFHWRTITKEGRGWPSGFIHFNDKVLAPTAPPSIVGTPKVGTPVTATQGTWNPAGNYAYQWAAGGVAVPGATASTFTPTAAVKGKKLSVTVTATKKGYAAGTASASTASVVAPGTMVNAEAPVISGTPQVDEVLQVSLGTWTPTPEIRRVRWFADGTEIPDATGWSLALTQALIDKRITARVSVKATAYETVAVTTAATAPVLAGVISTPTPFTLAGKAAYGKVLTVRPGTVDPVDATARYTWLRDGVAVAGANGPSYEIGAADVGHRLEARVDLARSSYRSLAVPLPAPGVVTTRATVTATAVGRPGRAVVRVRVRAPGVDAPTGEVTVLVGTRSVPAQVVGGRARVVVPGLTAGRKPVRVRFLGTEVVKPGKARTHVRVLRP
ncbi:CHAP domain-containing protein [Nocardioides dongkuii]|uniref:CHAP domain-containing protein n=1 Tax=Nocardioides dongkuii TaxID=2760089 RepID=UPI0015FB4068|nr:CHAP domain-containing protein [Nocardioides dongkuii]